MKLLKQKCRKEQGRRLEIIVSKEVLRRLPDYFFADIILENIEERKKEK